MTAGAGVLLAFVPMLRDLEHGDERCEDVPADTEPEPPAPWADLEHVYHEHDERL